MRKVLNVSQPGIGSLCRRRCPIIRRDGDPWVERRSRNASRVRKDKDTMDWGVVGRSVESEHDELDITGT